MQVPVNGFKQALAAGREQIGLWLARVGSKNPYPDARQGFTDAAGCVLRDNLVPGRWRGAGTEGRRAGS